MKEVDVFCFITNVAVAVFCGAYMSVLPSLTRKSFLFGVKTPPEQCAGPEARELKRRYIRVCVIGAAIILLLIIAQFILSPRLTLLGSMYFPLLFAAVQLAAFVPNHRAALRLKEERGWAVSESVFADTKSSHSRGSLANMPWGWYIAGLAAVVLGFVVSLAMYPDLPERIPRHYDFNMRPDAWSEKSLGAALMMPIINLIMLAFMWAVGGVPIEKAKLQIDRQNPALSFAQHKEYRRILGNGIGLVSLSIAAMFTLLGFMGVVPGFRLSIWFIILLPMVPCVWVVAAALKAGQGGCNLKIKDVAEEGETAAPKAEGDAKYADDRFWALGMFYHNPDDPAILVGDRFGGNIGFNYSRGAVKIGAAAAAAAVIIIYASFTVWWLNFI